MPDAYVIRHAMTAKNHPNERQSTVRAGGPDVPPSPEGRQQIAHVAQFFRGKPLHAVYTSDTRRAGATALAIAQATGATLHQHPGLRPWHIPAIAGKKYADIEPILKYLVAHPDERPKGGGESFRQFFERWIRAAKTIGQHAHDTGRHVALVTHGRNVKALWSVLKGQGRLHPSLPPHDPHPTQPGDVYQVHADGLTPVFRSPAGASQAGASS